MRDLKRVYRANTKDLAELALEELSDKWESKYPVVIASWRDNWEKLTIYFQYTADQKTHLYHQCRGRLSPATAESDQDQRRVHQRHGPAQAGLFGNKKHRKEMDIAFAKLGLNCTTTGHSIWRSTATGGNP
jgi:hypothetical protein